MVVVFTFEFEVISSLLVFLFLYDCVLFMDLGLLSVLTISQEEAETNKGEAFCSIFTPSFSRFGIISIFVVDKMGENGIRGFSEVEYCKI